MNVLKHRERGASLESFSHQLMGPREGDDHRRQRLAAEAPGRFLTVHARHAQIHHHDLRAELPAQSNRVLAVTGDPISTRSPALRTSDSSAQRKPA